MTTFILASASPARLKVLRAAGLEPVVRVSDVDEDAVAAALPAGTTPEGVVVALAQAKARTVAAELSAGLDGVCWLDGADAFDSVLVGCDSMLHIASELQGKPLTVEVARQRWATMAGRSGELLTGHCVLRLRDGKVVAAASGCTTTTVHFGSPTDADLTAYLASGEPLQVAGAFTLDGLGGWFVEKIDGDPSSVIGIGLPLVRRLLSEVGVSISDLWDRR
ncbi:septum formation inhibitor Maf [Antrihabitans sp. YC3-6]|uniref:Nucleoside triphosphate pyrophosphatase n=1 Tax=Antrihabitans stalagmiti TaxID=2799499 RepID=A0A934NNI7_9NOCA|nr:nucleoside triphosphate pyrophosphatase [Antrihabitans stalagmiti]MBJ8338442.1 septum formation inhibitor Maf [Antrihabitans stalagmiti]